MESRDWYENKKKKEKKRKERKKEEKRDFSTKAIDLKEKKKKKKERDRGLDRDTKRNGEDVETLLWASFGDRGSEVEQGNRESYDCHGINKCGEVAALHGWTSEPETLPSYRFLLSFVSLASCLSRHRAEGSWLHNFALLLLDLAFFHSSIGPAFHSPSPPFFFSMHNLSLSLSLFSSFLLALALEGNRCTPSLSFYLYARCGQIILESYYILVARSSPPSTFSPGHSPFGKNAGAESLSPIFPPALWTDYVNTSRCFLATCICSPFWILPGIFTIQRPAATIFFFLLLPANRRPTRSCQEYSRFLG